MMQTVLYSFLVADEELSALVAGRIYPMRLPNKEPLPALVYQVISKNPLNSLDGDRNVDQVSLQITCWAGTYESANLIAAEVRRVISAIPILSPSTDSILDSLDQDTKNFGIVLNFAVWDGLPAPYGFRYKASSGDLDTTGVSLPVPIVTNGFYLVVKNGAVMKEGEDGGYYLNESRDRVIFVSPLGAGQDLDQVLVIFQPVVGDQFSRLQFNGVDNPDGIDISPVMVENGYHAMTLNGTFSKEGDRYEIDPALDRVDFLTPLESDDEGEFVWQNSQSKTFQKVVFDGGTNPLEVDLPEAIVEGGLYYVVVNGRISKEGVDGRYTVNSARNKIVFNQSLEGVIDEGFVIYQSS